MCVYYMQNEAVARMYRKYHPQEHEYFKTVDGEYVKRLFSLLEGGSGDVIYLRYDAGAERPPA